MSDFTPLFHKRREKANFEPLQPSVQRPGQGQFVGLVEQLASASSHPGFIPDLGTDLEPASVEPGVELEAALAEARAGARAQAQAEVRAEIQSLQARLREAERQLSLVAALQDGLAGARSAALHQATDDMLSLLLVMTRRVVGDSLAIHPDALLGVLRGALDRVPGEDSVTVKVRPEDLSLLEGKLRLRRPIKLVPDPEMSGGCVVETNFGKVDASLDAAMAGLKEAVESWRQESQI